MDIDEHGSGVERLLQMRRSSPRFGAPRSLPRTRRAVSALARLILPVATARIALTRSGGPMGKTPPPGAPGQRQRIGLPGG